MNIVNVKTTGAPGALPLTRLDANRALLKAFRAAGVTYTLAGESSASMDRTQVYQLRNGLRVQITATHLTIWYDGRAGVTSYLPLRAIRHISGPEPGVPFIAVHMRSGALHLIEWGRGV